VTEQEADPGATLSPERTAAFLDAAVAIALTLLILPLMEGVNDREHDGTAAGWFTANESALISFLVSFVMILMFWTIHHRLFRSVTVVTSGLMWLVGGWLLAIIWLPVATSMSGSFGDEDTLTRVVYIGSLILVCVMSFLVRTYLLAHPAISTATREHQTVGMAIEASMIILFAVALVIGVLVPAIGYWALFIMFLGGSVQRLLRRIIRGRR